MERSKDWWWLTIRLFWWRAIGDLSAGIAIDGVHSTPAGYDLMAPIGKRRDFGR
jgi:hypothetical protein